MVNGRVKIILLISALALFFFLALANRPVVGQEEDFQTSVTEKLDEVLKNQANILAQIEATKEEIVRLRKWTR